jgi:Leucine-rich repeat (LRR) protein
MVLAGVKRAGSRRGLNESVEAYLARLTHLNLDGRGIGGNVEAIAGVTPGVRVLYLYDNVIARLAGIERLTKLTHLYLQNNRIARIEGLERCASLTKLYLDGNRLAVIDNLEGCVALEELHVSAQKPQMGEHRPNDPNDSDPSDPAMEVRFDPACFAALGRSLRVLNAGRNPTLRDPRPIKDLALLRVLSLEKCGVESARDLEPALLRCVELRSLDVRGCPLARDPKHRDHVTLLSDSLVHLNGREIKPHERQFLVQLQTRRIRNR